MADVPNTFVAGETAKASEVNENFNALANGINESDSNISRLDDRLSDVERSYANKNGSADLQFNVGTATASTNAVNKGQVDKMLAPLIDYISGLFISKNGENSIIVSKGSCYDTTHTVQIELSENTNFENTNQEASNTYYVYLSVNDDGLNLQCLFTKDRDNKPSGAERYRCIGRYSTNNNNEIDITTIISYGTNQAGTLSPAQINDIFIGILPDLSTSQTFTGGSIHQAPSNGWLRWVCNENDTTRDLQIGVDSNNMLTVARVRAAAANDACGTAALIPIKSGWYFKSSKSTIYFYELFGGGNQ